MMMMMICEHARPPLISFVLKNSENQAPRSRKRKLYFTEKLRTPTQRIFTKFSELQIFTNFKTSSY